MSTRCVTVLVSFIQIYRQWNLQIYRYKKLLFRITRDWLKWDEQEPPQKELCYLGHFPRSIISQGGSLQEAVSCRLWSFLFGVLLLALVGKVGSVRPIGGKDTAKLPCLEEEAAAACSMPLKPGTLWRQLAILVGASLGKLEFKTSCCLISGHKLQDFRHSSDTT